MLSPDAFQEAFIRWAEGLTGDVSGKVVALDGKTLRRSFDRAAGRSAIHVVSAWCTESGVALGQVKTAEKSNEITAIPALLELLHLKGAIVTIDAMGCQKKITKAICDGDADYIIAVKNNQPKLAAFIEAWFDGTYSPSPHPRLNAGDDNTAHPHGGCHARRSHRSFSSPEHPAQSPRRRLPA